VKSKFLIVLVSLIFESCTGIVDNRPIGEENLTQAVRAATPPQANVNMVTAVIRSDEGFVANKGDEKPFFIRGGKFCEDYLLKKVTEEKNPDEIIEKIKTFNTDNELLSPELKQWLDTADMEQLEVFKLARREETVLILGSRNIRAAGIASEFQNWFVQLGGQSIGFMSLSKDPRLIFFDKNNLLNYYVVDFSIQFMHNRDWDNPTFDLQRFRVDIDGKPQLLSEERFVECK